MYYVSARYDSEAERKRIEYLMDRLREKYKLRRPLGITEIVESGDISGFLEELFTRVPRENVEYYELKEFKPRVSKEVEELEYTIGEPVDSVAKFIGYLMARFKGALEKDNREPFERVYKLYSKKGRATARVKLKETGEGTKLYLGIEGFGDIPGFLVGKFRKELDFYSRGV